MEVQESKVKTRKERLTSIDFCRSLAIAGMVLCHCVRIVPFADRPDWSRLVLALEPWCQVLFLYLLGISARLGWASTPIDQWLPKQAKRVVMFFLLGALLVVLENGRLQAPVTLFSGFLPLAAKGILLLLLLAWIQAKGLAKAGLGGGMVLLAVSALLDAQNGMIQGLNAGSGPFLPLAAIVAFGWEMGSSRRPFPWLVPIFSGAVILVAAVGVRITHSEGLLSWLAEGGRISNPTLLLRGRGEVEVFYYSLSVLSTLFWWGVSVILVSLTGFFEGRLAVFTGMWGRHPLLCYLTHLLVLALVYISGFRLSGHWLPWCWAALILALYVMCWGVERQKMAKLGKKREKAL